MSSFGREGDRVPFLWGVISGLACGTVQAALTVSSGESALRCLGNGRWGCSYFCVSLAVARLNKKFEVPLDSQAHGCTYAHTHSRAHTPTPSHMHASTFTPALSLLCVSVTELPQDAPACKICFVLSKQL